MDLDALSTSFIPVASAPSARRLKAAVLFTTFTAQPNSNQSPGEALEAAEDELAKMESPEKKVGPEGDPMGTTDQATAYAVNNIFESAGRFSMQDTRMLMAHAEEIEALARKKTRHWKDGAADEEAADMEEQSGHRAEEPPLPPPQPAPITDKFGNVSEKHGSGTFLDKEVPATPPPTPMPKEPLMGYPKHFA